MNKAIEMNYNTEGILLMSDDVLLKYWKLKNLNQKKIWFVTHLKVWFDFEHFNSSNKNQNGWWWSRGGVKALNNLFYEFNSTLGLKNNTSVNKIERIAIIKFLNNLKNHEKPKMNDSIYRAHKIASDIFYLPRTKFKSFHFACELFRKHQVFLEIAVPTILAGIDDENTSQIYSGNYYWGRQFNFSNYNSTQHFAHPMKLNHKYNIKPICEIFVRDKYSNLVLNQNTSEK